ncbi:Fis family transcriptional regulator [Colwellia sp. D2M02]|uniref:Fis family transcriptional regulator n=1 Tax=Colwellia sp. D2M02 TaxID=2841562 RepID=UPI001C0A66E9|nr:Fis family transcriptional regulator [Colwellia sp. D2M02]MBU2893744.1 Fis family transcriptional regulator [Colwellia sp. D2M02]
MKLNKTSQKIDNNVCKALTIACESALHEIEGFEWLTHRASYTNFPASLVVTCVFTTDEKITAMLANKQDAFLRDNIQKQLLKVGVVVKNINHAVRFDSEESCLRQHQGQWPERLALNISKQKPNQKGRALH